MKKYGQAVLPLKEATTLLDDKINELNKEYNSGQLSSSRRTQIKRSLTMFIPLATLMAFRVEIALKAAIEGSGGTVAHEHKLEALFNTLNLGLQNQVKSEVSDPNFESKLHNFSNAFVEWRYFFEANEKLEFDLEFAKAIASAIEKQL